MTGQELATKYCKAAEAFNHRESSRDGTRIATSLDAGLSVLRDSFYRRLHDDVERIIGTDSMLLPVSIGKAEAATKREIEYYQLAESHGAVQSFGYLANGDWYIEWLARLRLGQFPPEPSGLERLDGYLAMSADHRRLAFTNVLARILPESRRAPLVLFRLFPLAIQLATALAFGDHSGASKLRSRQVACLFPILECRECRGRVLDNGEQCRVCGNPLWRSEWLVATD